MASTVNNETLRRLVVEVGEETLLILLAVFVDELQNYLDQLVDAPTIGQIREISHSIKTSAASFGADELAEFACECESRIKLAQDTWIREQQLHFVKMLQVTVFEYKNLMKQQVRFDN